MKILLDSCISSFADRIPGTPYLIIDFMFHNSYHRVWQESSINSGDKMVILAINAYHGDSSACLVIDGKLIAAAEEERFRRVKHWAGFPIESIRYCLNEAGKSTKIRS